jgi:hypothetical protein
VLSLLPLSLSLLIGSAFFIRAYEE